MSTPTRVAGRYRIERRLGAGGMSTVFMALDTVLERARGREAAGRAPGRRRRVRGALPPRGARRGAAPAPEHRAGVRLRPGPGVAPPLHRHGVRRRPVCADLLREHRQLGIEETVGIVRDACHGLDYAHRAGVVHRDVKPGNLLIANESGTVKLADFGIAKAAEQTRITQVGSVLGTAAYLSPEQARARRPAPASDIYSLGVCAYQFLTGRLPHEYSSLTELALKQQSDVARADHELPPRGAAGARPGDPALPRTRPRRALRVRARDGRGARGGRCTATRPTRRSSRSRPRRSATTRTPRGADGRHRRHAGAAGAAAASRHAPPGRRRRTSGVRRRRDGRRRGEPRPRAEAARGAAGG